MEPNSLPSLKVQTTCRELCPCPWVSPRPQVCMTGLSTRKAAQFFRSDSFISAQHTTLASGIQALVPGAGAAG